MPITSLLDTDLYKLTMQQAVLEHYPDAQVTYQFINRGKHRFSEILVEKIFFAIKTMKEIRLSQEEKEYLAGLSFFKPQYLEYLANYRFDPSQIEIGLDFTDNKESLEITIGGPWHSTILWEVPLMALISELYFEKLDINKDEVFERAYQKSARLTQAGCTFAEFGTRRRRSSRVQEIVLQALMKGSEATAPRLPSRGFVGTSNVRLAMLNNIRPIGTMAHELIMGISALESLRYANRYALQKWKETYKANLGIALTDTFGSAAFFKDFDLELAKVYDGVRHDSGDPIAFGEAVIACYESLKVDPTHKTIIFSDGLNVDKCIEINQHFYDKINVSFGIGTHLTNDFEDAKALNMVIKLRTVNDIPVIKLSDEPGKETGDEKAIEVAKWTFGL